MSSTDHDTPSVFGDARLRALYRLADRVDGDELERVREAIAARRRALEQAEHRPAGMLGPKRTWRPRPD